MIWLSVKRDAFIDNSFDLHHKSLYLKPRLIFGGITRTDATHRTALDTVDDEGTVAEQYVRVGSFGRAPGGVEDCRLTNRCTRTYFSLPAATQNMPVSSGVRSIEI